MSKITRVLGGVLLVSGTTIGAGMLALPVITCFAGFYPSIFLFFFFWLLMLCTAFFFLDVCLSLKEGDNLVSMAGATLGIWGKGVCWIFYLLLLYCLTAAFIAGSAPLFFEAIKFITGYSMPKWMAPLCLPVIFGSCVYLGTKGVDYVNRLLMLGLVISYFLLVSLVPQHMQTAFLDHFDWTLTLVAVPIVITSFGYHIIIPSLSVYLKRDIKLMRIILVLGSVIPLIVYLIWQFLVIGAVPLPLLKDAWLKGEASTIPLGIILDNQWIKIGARFFSFFAIVTSFLGSSLGLSDFLRDGFKLKKNVSGSLIASVLTFVPPLIFVYVLERGFYLALQYAGVFVAVLIGVLPAAMAWRLKHAFYQSFWGRFLLSAVIIVCLAIIAVDILVDVGVFKRFLAPYLAMP